MNPTQSRAGRWDSRNVTAVLGPTNTGKTHLAIERMLGHETGVIGLPLRLLAREVYTRVAERAGAHNVALITGEEKILPPNPRYWVSTVEAMPRETDAAFVAIDEVQLAADLERGHVFTDRILNLRGSQETLLLGAATMRGIIEQLLPGVHVVTRPRMSVLAYAGQKKITRLPERSAVVTFSADEVYAVAELIRRQRGGAAVVLGALSPRTRNKQVELYQNGDVDFLVATDAIGMGLNLDLDHVAFAADSKFDGHQFRELTAAELAQIAGRAGRHMRDGTFGVTGRVAPFPDPLVEAIESHRFEPVKTLQWRNGELDFSSLAALKESLERPASVAGLSKAPPTDDQVTLEMLARDGEIRDRAQGKTAVRRLWDVCRLPDYRRIAPAQHAQIVGDIFTFLSDGGVVPDDWIASQIRHANHTEGDIDTLSSRIAHIRTWTFVANQPDWLGDAVHWREEARAVEDALSDALHERLTKRFVDRRTSVLMRRLRENTMLEAEITVSGEVLVEGQHVGVLQGFRFTPDVQAEGAEAKALRAAAQKALATAIVDRAERLAKAADSEIILSSDGNLRWRGEPIGRLLATEDALKPRILILADEQLTGPARDMVEARLQSWLTTHIGTLLQPLMTLATDQTLTGIARGVAFRLVENYGVLDRRDVAEEIRSLDQEARAQLRRFGVRFGSHHIYLPALLKPAPSTLLAQLWALKEKDLEIPGLAELPAVSSSGRTSVNVETDFDPAVYRRFGFRVYGRRAIRIDILERLADLIRPALSWNAGSEGERPDGAVDGQRGFVVTQAMTSLLGASGEDMAVILKGLGYRMDRRPKPQPVAAETQPAEPVVPANETEEAPAASTIAESVPDAEVTPAAEIAPETAVTDEQAGLEAETQEASAPEETAPALDAHGEPEQVEEVAEPEQAVHEDEIAGAAAQEQEVAEAEPASVASEASASDGSVTEDTAASAEPDTIEVWQPAPHGGRGRGQGGRPNRQNARGGQTDEGEQRTGGRERRGGQNRGGQNRGGQNRASENRGEQRGEGPNRGETRAPQEGRTQEPREGQRQGRRPDQRPDNRSDQRGEQRRDRPDRGPRKPDQNRFQDRNPRPPRDRPVDPDNPFAALAALKSSLEKSGPK
ncbi:ATP-dependent RNA helicase SUPV3L1/SUV3 [Faunimonas pinastri]|uniref:ATP-dependent RNA helicase SUPV3L1/SUV3 n=1 Tax=Faunimonas pinastri TaxID=1855383 RepID=A0A1H9C8C6_9HYPH|nr:helicase-related protein [Faunimonas pinastri]SEP97500.1 ATP-dependent RNA helicase SUPV3L1/SUV3 [Faunimonas pinastri]